MAITTQTDPTTDWLAEARCRGLDPSIFYPDKGVDRTPAAIAVCMSCPVQRQCLDYSIEHRERMGVWGGATPNQRRRVSRARYRR